MGAPDVTKSDGTHPSITSLYVTNCEVFAGTECGLFKSTDGCKTWTRPSSIDSNLKVVGLVRNNSVFFAGTDAGGIYSSDDDGISWRKTNAFDSTLCMEVTDSFIVAGNARGMQRCRIDDSVWAWVNADTIPHGIMSIAAKDSIVVAGGFQGGVYRSNDFGSTWKTVVSEGLPLSKISSIAIGGETICASLPSGGLFCIVNCGVSWAKINGLTSSMFGDVVVVGSSVLIATKDTIYCTDFFGTTLHSVNNGLENKTISTFFLSGSSLYAGSEHDGVWYRSVSDLNVPTIRSFDNKVVRKTDLKLQRSSSLDYHSVVKFTIPESMQVKVVLYDLCGHTISTPVNDNFNKGMYSIPISSDNIAHGVYIAKMNAGGSVITAR